MMKKVIRVIKNGSVIAMLIGAGFNAIADEGLNKWLNHIKKKWLCVGN